MTKFRLFAAAALAIATPTAAVASAKPLATLYKNPQCSCCEGYAAYLRAHGYQVRVIPSNDLPLMMQRQGVPAELAGCHVTLVGGYFVDGHVPADAIDRLLKEHPAIKGITLPGMPMGAPGMAGRKNGQWVVTAIGRDGRTSVYAKY